jgi:hypothetical protein
MKLQMPEEAGSTDTLIRYVAKNFAQGCEVLGCVLHTEGQRKIIVVEAPFFECGSPMRTNAAQVATHPSNDQLAGSDKKALGGVVWTRD